MEPTLPAVDLALPALRALLDAAGVAYRLVGGVAVVHHGYARTTRDVDVLLDPTADARLAPLLTGHGFARESRTRLRHLATGVSVDLLLAGDARPRAGRPPYPAPQDVPASDRDGTVIGLAALLEMKLHAGRHQDQADIVALLKPRSEAESDREEREALAREEYTTLEAALPAALRPEFHALWCDAREELAWET